MASNTQLFLGDIPIETALLGSTIVEPNFLSSPIPTDGLVAWYDASNTTSYPGSGTTWYDLSPLQGSGSLIGTPTFDTGSKWFTFNGTTQRVNLTQFLPASQTTYSYYVVAKSVNAGTTQVFGQGLESNNRRGFMIRISGFYGFNGYNNDNNTPTSMNVANNALKGIGLTMNTKAATQSQALRFYLNGSFVTTSGTTGGATNLNLGTTARIGSNAGNTELFNGSIAVCIAYNRVLTDTEMSVINSYYATKYTFA